MILSGTLLEWRGLTVAGDRNQGYRVVMEELDGWGDWEGDGDSIRRPLAHGSFDAPVHVPERLVTIAGMVSGQDRDEVRLLLERELTPGADLEPLTITSEGRTLTAMARLDRVSLPRTVWGAGIFRYAIRWRAPDPLRYGAPVSVVSPLPERIGGLEFPLFGLQDGTGTGFLEWGPRGDTGRRVLSNPGTAPVAPHARVVGPLPAGFSLRRVDTGETLTWAGSLSADEWVDVDFHAKRVRLMGTADRTHLVTSGQWWTVPAGADVEAAFTAPSYDPAASVTWTLAPGWW